jgi:hypothetical protein
MLSAVRAATGDEQSRIHLLNLFRPPPLLLKRSRPVILVAEGPLLAAIMSPMQRLSAERTSRRHQTAVQLSKRMLRGARASQTVGSTISAERKLFEAHPGRPSSAFVLIG